MKTRISRVMLAILASIIFALPSPVLASPPEPLTIEANLVMTGPNSACRNLEISGLFEDQGNAPEVFFIADSTIHGIKTLVGSAGTITIHFQAQLTWTSQTTGFARGRFVVVSGTGAYRKLHGVGTTYAALNCISALPHDYSLLLRHRAL